MTIKTPKHGEYRYIWRYHWMPRRYDGYWVWLEKRYVRQIYFYEGVLLGWYDICLSNPKDGLPLD